MAFKKGTSGNPSGRPKGTTCEAKIRKLIESQADDLIRAVTASALDGDMTAAKILIDRICPAYRPKDQAVSITGLDGTLTEQGAAIIQTMGKGTITPNEASSLLSTLVSQSKIKEIDELTKRIENLENAKMQN